MDVDIGIYVTMHISSVGTYVQAIVRIPTAAHASRGIYVMLPKWRTSSYADISSKAMMESFQHSVISLATIEMQYCLTFSMQLLISKYYMFINKGHRLAAKSDKYWMALAPPAYC